MLAGFWKYWRLGTLSAIVLTLVCAALFAYARSTRPRANAYQLATDFPRGPLVYAQFRDLPALIKQWDGSQMKQQYLASANYGEFMRRHIALKLLGRLKAVNDAIGFELDTSVLSSAAESSAAIAVYDIGRLDILFIAPVSNSTLSSMKFIQGKQQFEEMKTADGAIYYRRQVSINHGKQGQALVFASVNGRFILATNEELMVRAITNISGKTVKDSLSDDPSFTALSAIVAPHFATVWADQSKLNSDGYFRRYWLMPGLEKLKGIRACMIDLEQQDKRWIERRDFLTLGKESTQNEATSEKDAQHLLSMIPGDSPYVKVESAGGDSSKIVEMIRNTIEDKQPPTKRGSSRTWSWRSFSEDDFAPPVRNEDQENEESESYSYIGSDYESTIDDPRDARIKATEEPGQNPQIDQLESQFTTIVQQAIGPAHPTTVATVGSPELISTSLFAEFRRAVIVSLRDPANLNRDLLEAAITKTVEGRLTIAAAKPDLKWITRNAQATWSRELVMPVLGWRISYALHGGDLIVSNSSELLASILNTKEMTVALSAPLGSSLSDLTIVRLDKRKQAFDDIVTSIDAESIRSNKQKARSNDGDSGDQSPEFFSGNLSSLLDVTSVVGQVQITRTMTPNHLHEELDFVLK